MSDVPHYNRTPQRWPDGDDVYLIGRTEDANGVGPSVIFTRIIGSLVHGPWRYVKMYVPESLSAVCAIRQCILTLHRTGGTGSAKRRR